MATPGVAVNSRNLILVSPHFPPTNAADHQRVRQVLPFLAELGWNVHVVAVDARDVPAPQDEFLTETLPSNFSIERVRVPSGWRNRIPGFGSLGYKSTRPIGRAITHHLERIANPDLPTCIYFSTTQFPVHRLIPRLKRYRKLSVAMDYQDPWATDYYREHPNVPPPGGRLRFAIANYLAFREEAAVLPWVDGFTAVSPGYEPMLRRRYPGLGPKPFCVLPFAASTGDFEALRRCQIEQTIFNPNDGNRHWVYVGRGGIDMHLALSGLFLALRKALSDTPDLKNVRLHFIGTDYAPAAQAKCNILPLAEKLGVADQVTEHPARIPYGTALRCLTDAHALIVPGSDDASYTASKLYPYLLARKPTLTIFHEESSVVKVIAETAGAMSVVFSSKEEAVAIGSRVGESWFTQLNYERTVPLKVDAFEYYTAPFMANQLSDFLAEIADSNLIQLPRPLDG
jgi:hypothetical protein